MMLGVLILIATGILVYGLHCSIEAHFAVQRTLWDAQVAYTFALCGKQEYEG